VKISVHFRYIFIAFFCILLILKGNASEKFQVTFQLAPTYEKLSPRDKVYKGLFGYKLSYNFGVEYRVFSSPDFSFSTGILMQDKGFRNELQFKTSDSISQTGAIAISTKYLTVPLDLNRHIHIAEKTELVLTGGFSFGYLFSQSFIGRRVPDDLATNTNTFLGEEVTDKRSNIDWFNKLYWGLDLGVGVTQYIKSKMVIMVQPTYYRQLNKVVNPEGPLRADFSPKLDSFALNIRVGYYFSDQIKNYKKSL
jgi:hypothetical protein